VGEDSLREEEECGVTYIVSAVHIAVQVFEMVEEREEARNMGRSCQEICDVLSEPLPEGEGDTVEIIGESDTEVRSHAFYALPDDRWPGP